MRGGKIIELKETVDRAVEKCPTVKRVFVVHRTGNNVSKGPLDIELEEVSITCITLHFYLWLEYHILSYMEAQIEGQLESYRYCALLCIRIVTDMCKQSMKSWWAVCIHFHFEITCTSELLTCVNIFVLFILKRLGTRQNSDI